MALCVIIALQMPRVSLTLGTRYSNCNPPTACTRFTRVFMKTQILEPHLILNEEFHTRLAHVVFENMSPRRQKQEQIGDIGFMLFCFYLCNLLSTQKQLC